MTDQQRYDAIRRVQDELLTYDAKLKIRTPNLDRLSREGAYVRTAYTQSPVCGPARTTLRTGCTIERTGVQTNPLDDSVNGLNPKLFQNKINQLEGLDQILVEDHGYVSEYYGKWHLPSRLYDRRDGSSRAVESNDYDYYTGAFSFKDANGQDMLRRYLDYFHERGDISKTFADGQQKDSYSEYPYTPISIDSRYGLPTNTPLSESNKFEASEDSQMGNFTLGKHYSASFFNHDVALRALNRLASQNTPFLLTVSYHHPHPPFMASFEYLSYYWDRREDLFESPTMGDGIDKTTSYVSPGDQKALEDAGYCDVEKVKELTAVYYALVEEIDTLVGIMLERLDKLGIANNTLVVFTSDHGEMLGAHCQRGKNNFYEDSVRVPLFIKLPGVIPAGTVVDEPTSLINVFGTILDYAGAGVSDNGDGLSLRPYIEGTLYNSLYDETAAVSEWDFREPIDSITLTRSLDDRPNFMIRHGNFKLLIYKKAASTNPDVLFNLADDPFEINNLINGDGLSPTDASVGKAEHLRYLLLDWMHRVQETANSDFYSEPIYNANEGQGDINEILLRQSWRASDMWVGDQYLIFRKVALVDSSYTRNEWLYIGRRTSGSLLCSFQLLGVDASLFHLNTDAATVPAFDAFRLKVTLAFDVSVEAPGSVAAYIRISCDASDALSVPLYIDWDYSSFTQEPTGAPAEYPSECPTELPTASLTAHTESPTEDASENPTEEPTEDPTISPTEELLTTCPTPLDETSAPSSGPTSYPTTRASSAQEPHSADEQMPSYQPSPMTPGSKLPNSANDQRTSHIVAGFLTWVVCGALAFAS
jgi:arylsulfatase A-like enzyme